MNFWEKLLAVWRKQKRCRKDVLLIILEENMQRLILTGAEEVRWEEQEELTLAYNKLTSVAYWEAVENFLRRTLLAHDAEEGLDCVFVPSGEMLYGEELELPVVDAQEVRKTVAWEAEQAVPWPADSYLYTYAVTHTEDKLAVQLAALPLEVQRSMQSIAGKLLFKLEEINVLPTWEQVRAFWYEGRSTAWQSNAKKKIQAYLLNPAVQKLARVTACTILFMCVLIFGVALAGRYLAQQELEEVHREMQQEQVWEQRIVEHKQLLREIATLQGMQQRLEQQRILWSEELPILAKQLGDDCWLTGIEQGKSRSLQLEGRAYSMTAVQDYVHSLEKCGRYQDVKLLGTQNEAQKGRAYACAYKVELTLKDSKATKAAKDNKDTKDVNYVMAERQDKGEKDSQGQAERAKQSEGEQHEGK